LFAGTPEFALASLTALVDAGYVPAAVYTQPDRPAGRGRRLTASPVKRYAEDTGIPVFQPMTLREPAAVAQFAALKPDVLIVAAYGLILPQEILDIPSVTCLNVHASVLPRWRGAAPIQAAILAGDKTSGVTLMRMTAGLDCGPVYSETVTEIAETETAGSLHDRLAALGGQLLVKDLPHIVADQIEPVEQDESLATYAGKIQKSDAELDWTLSAETLQRQVRAYNPVPGAYFFAHRAADAEPVRIKVWTASREPTVEADPGCLIQYDSDGIVMACGDGALRLESLQLPGKRSVSAKEFVRQIDLRR
jgi:methionyl-tRNA formyltransferase